MNALTIQQSLLQSGINRLDAEVLLAHALNVDRSYLYSHPEKTMDTDTFFALCQRRLQGPVKLLYCPCQSGLLSAKPLGRLPDSDVQQRPENQARRVSLSRRDLQSLSCVFCLAAGGNRRH